MSKFLILFLLILVSCAGEEPQPSTGVGDTKRYEPVSVEGDNLDKLHMICNALQSKADVLTVMSPTSYDYTFGYSQKNCSDSALPAPKDVKVRITKNSGSDSDFVFKMENGELFNFPNVETREAGVMKDICGNLGSLTSPMQTSSKRALWFTVNAAPERCTSDENGLCVYLQYGTEVEPALYRIHTVEWIKVRMLNPNRGFLVERSLASVANCSDKKTFEKKATLK